MTEREANVALSMKDVIEAVRKRVAAIEADASVVRTAEAHELLMVSHEVGQGPVDKQQWFGPSCHHRFEGNP